MRGETGEVDVLDRIADVLVRQVPGLEWKPSRGLVKRGAIRGPSYRLGLGRRGSFAWFFCRGLAPADPRRVLELSSGLTGPSRLVQSFHVAVAHMEATWPWLLPPEGQAGLLVADLHWLLGQGGLPCLPVVDTLRHRLWGPLMASDGLAELPAVEGCWEVRTGWGHRAMQVTFRRPHAQAISVSTLVANWTAEGCLAEQAAARLATMMNGRLRWVRLVLRDAAINAEVTLPAGGFGEQTWALARDALVQANRSCRAALRLTQNAMVAAEFMRLHPLEGRKLSRNWRGRQKTAERTPA